MTLGDTTTTVADREGTEYKIAILKMFLTSWTSCARVSTVIGILKKVELCELIGCPHWATYG